jgi:hypothetical protein
VSRFATVDYTLPDSLAFATWEGCTACSGGPQPGASALLAYWLEQAPAIAADLGVSDEGLRSLGIYNCRPVRGSTSLSIHACGRAVDLGVPVSVAGHRVMVDFLTRLAPHAKSLGIQLVIFSRTSGSARNPWPTAYGGVHPHEDHAHVELNGAAARSLTLATLRARVGDLRDVPEQPAPTPTPTPPPPKPSDWRQEVIASMDTVDLSSVTRNRATFVRTNPTAIRRLQSLLAAAGHPPANSFTNKGYPDGVGGKGTRDALEAFQRRARTGRTSSPGTPDAIAGRATWTALLGG